MKLSKKMKISFKSYLIIPMKYKKHNKSKQKETPKRIKKIKLRCKFRFHINI